MDFAAGKAQQGGVDADVLRAGEVGMKSGAQVEQYVADGTGVYAFSRVDKAGSGTEYLVAVNNADTAQSATPTPSTR